MLKAGKAQSAMEYLMTYGWAILIIAIVLAAVFELGVFNGAPLTSSNACLPQSGFLCSKPILNTTGELNINFGQTSGTTYTITAVSCSNSSVASSFIPISPITISTGLTSTLNFICPVTSKTLGAGFSGTLWVQYTSGSVAGQTAKVGTINAQITTGAPVNSLNLLSFGSDLYVMNQASSNVVIINTITGMAVSTITSGLSSPYGIAFAPSGAYAYITNQAAGNVIIINTTTSNIIGKITGSFSNPSGVAFAPSGAYAYVTNYTVAGNVLVINTSTRSVVNVITWGGMTYPRGVAISPSGTYAYIANYYGGNVAIINTATNTVTGVVSGTCGGPGDVEFAPSGTYAYVGCITANNVGIINTATNTITGYVTGTPATTAHIGLGIAFSKTAAVAYIVDRDAGNVLIVNTSTNTVTGAITGWFNQPYGAALSR